MANKTGTLKQLNEVFNRRWSLLLHVSVAETVLAYLAFTWSTVVLLGGYVTSLEKKDFYCLTLISLIEASWIFNNLESNGKLTKGTFSLAVTLVQTTVDITKDIWPIPANSKLENMEAFDLFVKLKAVLFTGILMAPAMAVIFGIFILLSLSPIFFVALPVWRIWQHNYGVIVGDSSKATLVPALDIFYSLVLVQGVLSIFSYAIFRMRQLFILRFYNLCHFPGGWGLDVILLYLNDIFEKSKKDLASVQEASLFSLARELLGSESGGKYVTGVRVLGTFAKQGMEDSIFTTLLSREKVQKLILTLGLTQSSTIKEVQELDLPELREHAARIVAGFADAIHLAQFPGAARCISTLLEATQDGSNELVVQGLTILGKLALDHHNCREICSTPGLLPKIMAPICSSELIQDTRIARSRVVRGTFKVLHRLIRVPGEDGRRLRRVISCNKEAVTNLESIIIEHHGNEDGHELELQMLAMEILLELAKDESVNLSWETIQNVIKKQLQIFLPEKGETASTAEKGETASTAVFHQQKGMAGKALSVLSSNSKSIATIIIKAHGDSVAPLIEILDSKNNIEILDSKNNIRHRIFAMEILRNLCKHCELGDKELPKEILLRKVLSEILVVSKGEQQTISSARGDDEEKQNPKEKRDSGNKKEQRGQKELLEALQSLSTKSYSRDEKEQSGEKELQEAEQSGEKELQEALLSLTLELYDLVGAERFALVVQKEAPGEGAFVAILKTTVEKNFEATRTSLRIVKLCCQIAISMLQHNQYTAHFKDLKFSDSVSNALEIMCETERCILIADTTGLEKKTLRPLLSELDNKLKQELRVAGSLISN